MPPRASTRTVPRSPLAGPYANAFVGRARDLEAIDAAFARGVRVVTLVGPGGIGKTRCAWEVAGRDRGEVVFCDLAEARSLDDVVDVVASALRLSARGRTPRDAIHRLADALSRRGSILLVVDNFEQVVALAPATISVWSAAAPSARFLVTSREVLRLGMEHVRELLPLQIPAPGEDPTGSEAVRLLEARVEQVRGSAGSTVDAELAGDVVRWLDGIPLALELAASRIAALGIGAVHALLSRRRDVLTRGPADAPGRHATLRAAVDWSWDLLADDERAVLERSSVFRGGFDIDALAACTGMDRAEVGDVVHRLVDKSMIRLVADADGATRHDLYGVIRDRAGEHLAARGEVAPTEARHAAHFVAEGETHAARFHGRDAGAALAWLRIERDNLVAVVERAIAAGPSSAPAAVGALLALHPVVLHHGGLGAHLARWDSVLGLGAGALDAVTRARALVARGRLRARGGANADARADLVDAVALARAHDRPDVLGHALTELGRIEHAMGDAAAARACLTDAISVLGSEPLLEGLAHRALGSVESELSRPHEALASFETAVTRLTTAGAVGLVASTRVNLGIARFASGDLTAARRDLTAALERSEHGDALPGVEAAARGALARLDHVDGDLEAAERGYRFAIERALAVDDRRFVALYTGALGLVGVERGDVDGGARNLDVASERLAEVGDGVYAALFASHRALVDLACDPGGPSASERLEKHLATVEASQAHELHEVVVLLRALADFVRRRPASVGDLATETSAGSDARLRLEETLARAASSRTAGADARIARRLVAQALAKDEPSRAGGDVSAPTSPAPTLAVASSGRWFRLPSGDRVDCAAHRTLRRVLVCLAEAAVERPGVVVTNAELMRFVWPDERPSVASRNRLKTLVSKLRKLGLRPYIESDPDGYALSTAAAVSLIDGGVEAGET